MSRVALKKVFLTHDNTLHHRCVKLDQSSPSFTLCGTPISLFCKNVSYFSNQYYVDMSMLYIRHQLTHGKFSKFTRCCPCLYHNQNMVPRFGFKRAHVFFSQLLFHHIQQWQRCNSCSGYWFAVAGGFYCCSNTLAGSFGYILTHSIKMDDKIFFSQCISKFCK